MTLEEQLDQTRQRMVAARTWRNLELSDVASEVGTSAIVDWERGDLSPTLDQMLDLCDLYMVSLVHLLLGEDRHYDVQRFMAEADETWLVLGDDFPKATSLLKGYVIEIQEDEQS